MEELTIEQKAKRYDEILARAKGANIPYYKEDIMSKVKEFVDYLLPELVESEDERIRKALIDGFKRYDDGALFNGCLVREILAWLEDQGEKPTLVDTAKAFLQALSSTPYNNTPIVEAQIITKQLLTFLSDPKAYNPNAINEHKSAAWSEEDEQLIDEVVVCLRKYAEKVQGGYSKSYVQSLADRIESLRPGNTCKATEWSEEDEAMFQGVIETEQYMLDVVYGRKIFAVGNEDLKEECTKELAWLKSLRPQKQWKSDWSEKDEKLLKLSLENLTELKNRFGEGYGKVGDCIYWLKSLKDRIK